MKPSDKLRELGFGNQAVIVGTKRKELFGVVDKMFEEETTRNVVKGVMMVDPNKTIIVEPKVNLDENKIRADEREKLITQLMAWTYTQTLSREQLQHKGCGNHNGNNECCRNETLELVRSKLNQ